MTNNQNIRLQSALISITLLLSACGGGDEEIAEISPVALVAQCSSHQTEFLETVWPIVNAQCFTCHTISGGVSSDFNLADETTSSDFNLINFKEFKDVVSRTHTDGTPLVLAKPTNIDNIHVAGEIFTSSSSEYAVFSSMVSKLTTCEDKAVNVSGLVLNTPYEQLRKTTLSLASRLPTQAEMDAVATVADDAPALTTALDNIVDQVLTEDSFYTRLKEIFNDLLLLDAYPGNRAVGSFDLNNFANKDYFTGTNLDGQGYTPSDRNLIREYAGYGLAQAFLELIAYVVKNDRPFTEILTADYVLVNPYSATLFDANVTASFNFQYGDTATQHDHKEFRATVLTDNNSTPRTYPHAGILTTLTFLSRYPSTNTNRNRARSRVTFLYFLDTDVQGLADRSGLDLGNVIGEFPPLEDPQCRACHDTVDPIAGLFKNWTNRGRFNGNNTNWFSERNTPQMLSPGYTMDAVDDLPNGQGATALQWLAGRITQDSRFAQSMVKTVFKGITGQAVPQDAQFVESLRADFQSNNYDLKALIKKIINSVYFKAANLGSQENPADFAEIGMGRLLTPEQLHRKISAVTSGYSWRSPTNGNRDLMDLNTYKLLYGGIDSVNVTERITNPTALMAGVQERIALQTSCQSVPLDFNKPLAERVLFPAVDITDTPDDALGRLKIQQNIQHLYKQILGEELAIDNPEIDRAYNLLVAVRDITATEQIPADCRGSLGSTDPIRVDADKTVRPWMAVVAYLLSDFKFFYE